ncbi:DUF5793 family protein [Halorubrum amylolyticum]|jgi:hypothetical protein|uniref:DUF5793 family protein n=1 Tax=Halorubrum amylolyticum TaxID=2508724 RepID=UPI0010089A88|nr:DUF5793 family protein [Halorubrum amylolyticum]
MQGDQFTIGFTTTGLAGTGADSGQPVLRLAFDGSRDRLQELLSERLPDDINEEAVDVSFRGLSPSDGTDEGVLSLSDRVTGAYVLEIKTQEEPILEFVQAVREYAARTGHQAAYRIVMQANAETVTVFEKTLLLVYDANGTLRRHASLIPSDIEL